jgi:hypothetical protein
MVGRVVPHSGSASGRLSDLTAAVPADRTLQNLLGLVSSKLDVCSRLPIFEYEAQTEGHVSSATVFHEIAEQERRSFANLLACLRLHLDETAIVERDAAAGKGSQT